MKTKHYCVLRTYYSKDGSDKIELEYVRCKWVFKTVLTGDVYYGFKLAPCTIMDYLSDFIEFKEKRYGKCDGIIIDKNDCALASSIKDAQLSKKYPIILEDFFD